MAYLVPTPHVVNFRPKACVGSAEAQLQTLFIVHFLAANVHFNTVVEFQGKTVAGLYKSCTGTKDLEEKPKLVDRGKADHLNH